MPINIGSAEAIEAAGRKVVAVGDVEVAVFFTRGRFVAWHNQGPHQGGPVCQGGLYKRVVEVLDDERKDIRQDQHPEDVNIVCPWHGVEFDLLTGQAPPNPRLRLTPARIEIVDGEVWLDV
jgi:nitrite reductase/ring-hydroxylating ferredoxin subunit